MLGKMIDYTKMGMMDVEATNDNNYIINGLKRLKKDR